MCVGISGRPGTDPESEGLDICTGMDDDGAVNASPPSTHHRRGAMVSTCDAEAQIYETHTGVVILIGGFAYKVKKPLTTDFLDFSTVELRESACIREVFLNRRMAPESYRGVAHLSDPAGGLSEPVIVMRRYPNSARLATRVRACIDVEPDLAAIAEVLARFHATAERGAAIDQSGSANAVAARWDENIAVLTSFAGSVVDGDSLREIRTLSEEFMIGRRQLFADRIESGLVVDGHGDLQAEDIFCMPAGPVLLDCLEFDDTLRYVDCVDDVAFLAMDLEFLGRSDLADYLIDQYSRASRIHTPESLWHFYIAYRAVVRAKVDCIRFTQGRAESAPGATSHLELALEHLRAGAVRLIRIGGGPGTGKTTIASALSKTIGVQVISTDVVRRQLHEQGVITGDSGTLNGGLYSEQNVSTVYDTVLRYAQTLLTRGQSVILDGTWRDPSRREQTHRLAHETHSLLFEFECKLPLGEAQDRIACRRHTPSDATPAVAAALNAGHDESRTEHRIDTSQPIAESVAQIEAVCRLRSHIRARGDYPRHETP